MNAPTTLSEAIQIALLESTGKHKNLRARLIEDNVKRFIASKVFSKDIELERAFRIFFFRLFGGNL